MILNHIMFFILALQNKPTEYLPFLPSVVLRSELVICHIFIYVLQLSCQMSDEIQFCRNNLKITFVVRYMQLVKLIELFLECTKSHSG